LADIALRIWVRTQIETETERYKTLICCGFRVFNERLTMTNEQRVALYTADTLLMCSALMHSNWKKHEKSPRGLL